MKDQAIVCNIGHFDNEIQVDKLNAFKGIEKSTLNHRLTNIFSPKDRQSICLLKDASLIWVVQQATHRLL